jgi:integrase
VREISSVVDLRIHDLRHAFGTRAARFGINALAVRDALGLKTLAMTDRYVSRQHDLVRELVMRYGNSIAEILADTMMGKD